MSLAVADPLGSPQSEGRSVPRRWEVWRSPGDQPGWARPVLLGIAAVAALLYAWNLATVDLPPFYSVAVKSMSVSWQAFFYGALDPSATITVDKLAGSFAPQALSARIFGFHAWSVALPQVIEGVVSVLVMYRVVRRWAGVVPATLAAGIFALTPIAASMFGHSMEDGCLTMCLVLAADAYQRAVIDGRLRALVAAGVWVGIGFQCKMLEAWMIVPALAIGYAITAPGPLRRRLAHVGVAGVVMLAVSLSWIALYTFTPAADRPYVDGSTNNSAVTMVFGYNGLGRFGISVPGAVANLGQGGPPSGARLGGGNGPGFALPTGRASTSDKWTKLLDSQYAPEIGWLYPLALLALALGLIWRRREKRTDPLRGGLIMWGTWLLTFGIVYSDMSSIPHTAYMSALAAPIAALGGAGIVMFWQAYRAGGPRAWALPVAVAAELAWSIYVWSSHSDFLPWAFGLTIAAGVLGLAGLLVARLRQRSITRLGTVGIAVGVVAMLAAPATWAASVLDTKYSGSSLDASAGPAGGIGSFGGATSAGGQGNQAIQAFIQRYLGGGATTGGSFGGIRTSVATTLDAEQRRIYNYTQAHRGGAQYLMAVSTWSTAAPYILATGQEVLPMGGFSGSVPEPTLGHVQDLVHTGQLKFFLLDAGGGASPFPGLTRSGPTVTAVTNWVEKTCTKVSAANYGGTPTTPPTNGFPGGGFPGLGNGGTSTMYECTASPANKP